MKDFESINALLLNEFLKFTVEHPNWTSDNLPDHSILVLQTEDAEFNAWARDLGAQSHASDPSRPLVLVRIRELGPVRSRILEVEVEAVA